MESYKGSCHCGAVTYSFTGPKVESGLRCNCSICIRKGAVMSTFTIEPENMNITVQDNRLSCYQFDSKIAKHYFCNRCGIHTFHETIRKPGHYRVNLGCVEGINPLELDVEIFDGATLL